MVQRGLDHSLSGSSHGRSGVRVPPSPEIHGSSGRAAPGALTPPPFKVTSVQEREIKAAFDEPKISRAQRRACRLGRRRGGVQHQAAFYPFYGEEGELLSGHVSP